MPLSNRQFDEFHRPLLYRCLLSNILCGNRGWLNALFSTRHNCPLQFVAWKGYRKRKEGREEQLCWLGSKGELRENRWCSKRNLFRASACDGRRAQGSPVPRGGGVSPAQTKPRADGDGATSAPAWTGSNKPTCPRQPVHTPRHPGTYLQPAGRTGRAAQRPNRGAETQTAGRGESRRTKGKSKGEGGRGREGGNPGGKAGEGGGEEAAGRRRARRGGRTAEGSAGGAETAGSVY